MTGCLRGRQLASKLWISKAWLSHWTFSKNNPISQAVVYSRKCTSQISRAIKNMHLWSATITAVTPSSHHSCYTHLSSLKRILSPHSSQDVPSAIPPPSTTLHICISAIHHLLEDQVPHYWNCGDAQAISLTSQSTSNCSLWWVLIP